MSRKARLSLAGRDSRSRFHIKVFFKVFMLPVYTSLADKQQYYTCYRANSVEEIKTIFKNASSYNCVFRGVKDAKFRNYSSTQVNTDGTYSAFAFSEAIKESI